MKKILALTDFSKNAAHAIEYALSLAPLWQTEVLTLLHVYEAPVIFQPDPSGGMSPDGAPGLVNYALIAEQSEALAANSRQQINAFREQLSTRYSSISITAEVVEGLLGDVVNERLQSTGSDLVVMGIGEKSGLEKVLIGSNAIKAIEGIDGPLLIVPEQATDNVPKKIALASDLEILSDTNIRQLEQFVMRLPANELQVINVNMNPADPVNQERVSAIKAQLHRLNVVTHLQQASNVEAGLEEFVIQHQISLLVFLHHERSFLGQLFHKSIGKQIAWHTRIPILRLKG
ncbi:universal stress protein [Niabella sp. CC-SYL272]|uniref:universal stress protein n=1 Tax=Niabella agricola TaxID=2891571 RepID=UPI001F1CB156|nr:universal stress protein [Niabella agricola]MCF3109065.1 universal stress protein [Niabella agricola]